MATKPTKKRVSPGLVLVPQKPDPMDRIADAAERLVTKLFERDREARIGSRRSGRRRWTSSRRSSKRSPAMSSSACSTPA